MSIDSVLKFVREANSAQRALFDDHIRLDRVAAPADLPRVPLRWRRTLGGWRLEGTVLPSPASDVRRPCERPC
ncbi:MAG TPA: hypothetical protein VGL93_33775 [Streptosporangiaceae bacterium]|jgi:hypothetical protein